MASASAESLSTELFDEILLCSRYGELDDLTEYFTKLDNALVRQAISQQDSRGNTPLHFASANGHVEVVKLLLKNETAAIDTKNEGGNTALHWACLNGHLETVKLLIDYGVDVKLKNKGGRMAIDEAESQNKESVVLWLLALDMKREKEAGELAAEADGEDGDVNVSLTAGDTAALNDDETPATEQNSSEQMQDQDKPDDVDMLD